MPSQPPRYRPPGWKPSVRKPWARDERHVDKRLRGRAGQRARRAVLDEEPLCRKCLEQGRTTASEVVDHIRPLSQGGSDQRSNKQGLCVPCHDAKTKAEAAEGRRRADP
jgi:5-methylcytosine-specific restriction protein A